MAPWQLFVAVKASETLYHMRPRALRRLLFGGGRADKRYRQIMRSYYRDGGRVLLAEVATFLFKTRFARVGELSEVAGFPVRAKAEKVR